MNDSYEIERRYTFMQEAVDNLGCKALELTKGEVTMSRKADGTKVTTVDTELNDMFIRQVAAEFPDDLVWGEEASNSKKGNLTDAGEHWMWAIDPIDSTSSLWNSYRTGNFRDCRARIQIAAFAPSEKSPRISVIHNPFQSQKMTLFAMANRAYYQSSDMKNPVRVTTRNGPQKLQDTQRFEYNTWPGAKPDLSGLSELMPSARRVWHQLFMGAVALGDVDVSVFPGPSNPHDIAPGAHIVHAAGGSVLSLRGEAYEMIDWRLPVAGVVGAASTQLASDLVARVREASSKVPR